MALLYMQAKGYIEPLNKSTMPIETYTKALGLDSDTEVEKEFKDLTLDEDQKAKSIPMVKIKKPAIGRKHSDKEKTDMKSLKAEVLARVDTIQ